VIGERIGARVTERDRSVAAAGRTDPETAQAAAITAGAEWSEHPA
jgi:hypothetical protein